MLSIPFSERIIDSIIEDEIVKLQAGIIEYEVRLAKAYSTNDEKSVVERLVYPAILKHLRKELREVVGFSIVYSNSSLKPLHGIHGETLNMLKIGETSSEGLKV